MAGLSRGIAAVNQRLLAAAASDTTPRQVGRVGAAMCSGGAGWVSVASVA